MFPFFSLFFSRARRKTPANSPVLAARSSISASNHVAAVVMRVIVLNVFFLPFRCCFFFLFFLFFTNKNKPITKSTSKYEVSLEEGKQASWNGRRKERGRVFTRERRGEERRKS